MDKGEKGKGDAREACAVCHRGFVGGWLFRAEGIEWRWWEGLQVRREQIGK